MKRVLFNLVLLVALLGSVWAQTPGTSQYPTSLDTNTTLLTAINGCSTTLNGAVTNSATTFTVVSTSCFPSDGVFIVEGELVIYTGKTATTFTGLTRGAFSTSAVAHNNGIATRLSILAQYHNALKAAIIATQTKLGTGSATAANNQVLRGTGAGTTDFGQVTTNYLAANTVTFAKLQQITTARLLGRSTSGTGDVEELTIGANLSLAGGVLSATGGGSSAWSGLTDPGANLTLAMGTRLTAFNWASNYGSNPAFEYFASDTSATGPLVRVKTGVSTLMPPFVIEARGGQSFKSDHLGNIILGKDNIGGGDADGRAYLGVIGSNGTPSGTPTSITGYAPLTLESDGINAEYALWAYLGSAWRDLSGTIKRWDFASGSGNQTLDFNSSSSANVTRQFTASGGNVTFTAWNNPPRNGSLVTVIIVQDGTGSRTVTWPSNVKWSGGTAPTLTTTANKRDIFQFVWDGSNYYNVSQSLNQ